MIHCSGLSCDKTVEQAGQFCSSCEPDAPASNASMRRDLFKAAYLLEFGNSVEQDFALDEITFLANVLQHTKEETK